MQEGHLPTDSKPYSKLAEKIFEEKQKWHRRQAKISFTRKLEKLDRMRERYKEIPRVKRRG